MQRPTITRPSAADVVGIVLLLLAAFLVVVALIVAAG
jgi:hypothetical protein